MSARSQVPSQVATHQKIGSQLWAGEMPDLNPGLQDNSQVRALPLSHQVVGVYMYSYFKRPKWKTRIPLPLSQKRKRLSRIRCKKIGMPVTCVNISFCEPEKLPVTRSFWNKSFRKSNFGQFRKRGCQWPKKSWKKPPKNCIICI
jgi:hypothetical protein